MKSVIATLFSASYYFSARRILGLPALIAIVVAILSNTSILAQDSKKDGQPAKISVGAPSSVSFMPFFTAIAKGFFVKHGLDVEWIETNTPDPAVISGDINMMIKSAEVGAIAASRGRPLPALVMVQQHNSLSLDAIASLEIGDAKNDYPNVIRKLKDKTIAIPVRGSSTVDFVKKIMSDAGLQEGPDYSLVALGSGANIIAALRAKRVDAAVLWPPFAQQAYADKITTPLVMMAEGQGPKAYSKSAGLAVLVNPDYLKSHETQARQFVAAMIEASAFNRDYELNKEALIDIAARYSGLTDRAVLADAVRVTSSLSYPGIDCQAWELTMQLLNETNSLSRTPQCAELIATNIAPKGPLRQ